MSSAPVRVGALAQQLQETGRGRDDAHVGGDRLGDDRGQRVALGRLADGASASFQGTITVGAGGGLRYAGAGGDALGRKARSGLGEQAVDVAVIRACELEDQLAAGDRACQPDRAHRRLGARRGHPQHLDGGHARGDLARRAAPRPRSARRRWSRAGGARHRLDHVRIGVPEHERAPRAHPVDVLVAVDVGQRGARAGRDEDRVAADRCASRARES